MEKLQPFIKYHFWLLFLPAFAMPPAAWWLTTSDLQATIDERSQALDSSFGSISAGQGAPNQDWINKANEQIRIRTETNIRTVDRLWEWQKDLIKWPPNVAGYMKDCPYRGEITDNRISRRLKLDYRRDYSGEVKRVWLQAEPVSAPSDTAPKKVWFPLSSMPRVPENKWKNYPPPFLEIWNSQEDLWLLEQLLLAVQRTNAGANSISDSFVRHIKKVELFGGSRVEAGQAGSSAAGQPSAGAPPGAGADGSIYGGVSPFGPGGAGRGPTMKIPRTATFSINEEFTAKGLGNGGSGGGGGPGYALELSEPGGGPGAPGGGAPAGDDLNADDNRYVAVTEAYRTRGFHLVVTVHQQYVPDLIKELLNSQYPIDIIRMEQAALNPDEPDRSTEGSTKLPGALAATGQPGPAGLEPGYSPGEESYGEDVGEGPGDAFEESTDPAMAVQVSNAAVQAALEELDLVEVAILGEMYLYNPPAKPEGAEQTGDGTSQPPATPGQPVAPSDVTSGQSTTPAATTETPAGTVTPGTPALTSPTPGTPGPVPATSPESGTPEPAPATPAGSQPESPTPAPAEATPGSPASEEENKPAPATTSSDPDAPPPSN